jgi:hypothetical protein
MVMLKWTTRYFPCWMRAVNTAHRSIYREPLYTVVHAQHEHHLDILVITRLPRMFTNQDHPYLLLRFILTVPRTIV